MDDKEIIKLYYLRDESAIEKTKKKYEHYCYKIAENILGNHDDSAECVNDAYLKVWDSIPPQNPNNLSAYIGKIVRNISFDRYRKKHTEKRGSGEISLVLDELSECVSSNESVENELERKELLKEINSFLDEIGKEQSTMFIMRYWYVMPVSDIAEKMKMTASNVTTQLSRIRKNLKEYLKKRGYEI